MEVTLHDDGQAQDDSKCAVKPIGEVKGRYVLLYDGRCRFCRAQLKRLIPLARANTIEPMSFHKPGVLERFPGLSFDECMTAMHLVAPDGRVYKGFEAAVRALMTRPILGWPAHAYYLPGIRQVCDFVYAWIAANRYRLSRKKLSASYCSEGTCALHVRLR
jgi:predicted DCC family thiol-disulfide oxidoreductase YuxK